MEGNTAFDIIRKFAIAISQPIEVDLRIQLTNQVLSSLKPLMNEITIDQQFRLWKGFFYGLWYTEMEKGGRQLMQTVADNCSLATLMAGFQLLDQDWFSIDHIRLDKYMALVRLMLARLLRIQFKAIVLLDSAERKGAELSKDKQKSTKINSNLYKRLIKNLKAIGLVDHVIDITFEETFKVLGKHLKKPCLSLKYIQSVCNPLLQRLSNESEIRVLEVIEKELSLTVCDHIKRYSVVFYGYNDFINQKVTELVGYNLNTRNRKCLNRIKSSVHNRLGWIAIKPPSEQKVRYTYNRRKALKKKDERKKIKQLEQLAKKREELAIKQVQKYRTPDTLEDMLTVV